MALQFYSFLLLITFGVFTQGLPQRGFLGDSHLPLDAVEPYTEEFICPDPKGVFEDPIQCDKYWQCDYDVATPMLCEDGLVFDYLRARLANPCGTPYTAECGTRYVLQPPSNATEFCPRRHGIFPHPNPHICDIFYTCNNNHAVMLPCTKGLHFDIELGICAWPNVANRIDCDKAPKASVDGFSCPDTHNTTDPHPKYPNLTDCKKFFICISGVTPQKSACSADLVFDTVSGICKPAIDVPDCAPIYDDEIIA